MSEFSITRRSALTGALGLSLAACGGGGLRAAPPLAAAPSGDAVLKDLATAKGLRFGSAVAANNGGGVNNPDYAALLRQQCNVLVPENEMKWQAIRPSPDRFDLAAFDRIADFAKSNAIGLRGHTLLWHRPQWMPGWIAGHDFGSTPRTAAERMLGNHIATVMGRYHGTITSFDVVNETVLPEDGALAETALSSAFGDTTAMLDFAFHQARAAAPGAQLVYNDYMGWEPGNATHRAGVLKLLEGFRKRGVPIDALGIQSHLNVDGRTPEERSWRDFLDQVTAMGYALLITELDVRGNGLSPAIDARDAETAAVTKAFLDLVLSYRQTRDVLVWGMVDRFSWLQGFEPRADGQPTRGCPYDDSYRPKAMQAAIAAAFRAAPERS
jgi:endo-1,4-beta-xylanase